MGLVLLAGFCPMSIVRMELHELTQPKEEKLLHKLLTDLNKAKPLPPTDLNEVELLSRLIRLDGLMTGGIKFLETIFLDGRPSSIDDKCIYWIPVLILIQFQNAYKEILSIWNSSHLKDGERWPPSEFVRLALDNDIDIPWLEFAVRHYPLMLSLTPEALRIVEEEAGMPILTTEDPELEEKPDLVTPDENQHEQSPNEAADIASDASLGQAEREKRKEFSRRNKEWAKDRALEWERWREAGERIQKTRTRNASKRELARLVKKELNLPDSEEAIRKHL